MNHVFTVPFHICLLLVDINVILTSGKLKSYIFDNNEVHYKNYLLDDRSAELKCGLN